VYVSMSIMTPSEGYEQEAIGSMKRFGDAARQQPGLTFVSTLKDEASGNLVGIAVWESEEAAQAASATIRAVVANDDLGTWFSEMQNFRLLEA
jgi:heme-degrading monooxygenase HmoA